MRLRQIRTVPAQYIDDDSVDSGDPPEWKRQTGTKTPVQASTQAGAADVAQTYDQVPQHR